MTNKFLTYTSLLLTAAAFSACGPPAPAARHGAVDAPPGASTAEGPEGYSDAVDADGNRCLLGNTRTADDGCNRCACIKDGWACTAMGCGDTPPSQPPKPIANVASCPAPKGGPNLAAQVMTYVISPSSGRCCEYSTPQAAPADWTRFHNAEQCAAALDNKCSRGESVSAGDGCNSCTCGIDGRWSCTELGCIDTD